MREYPISLPLTTSDGTPISSTDGIYTILAGAETVYFYIAYNGDIRGEIVNIKYAVDDGVAIVGDLEVYVGSAWIPIPAYYAAVAGDGSSEEWNGSYPMRELIVPGVKIRVSIAVASAANVYCQVIGFRE